jgi:hypothetical protein
MEKDKTSNVILRYNDCRDAPMLVGGLQPGGLPGFGTGNQEYGNVLRDGAIFLGTDDGNTVFNNTLAGGIAAYGDSSNGVPTHVVSYNNITSNPGNSIWDCPNCNAAIFGVPDCWGQIGGYVWDFNMYDSDSVWGESIYKNGTLLSTLSAWRTAFAGSGLLGTSGRELHSQALNSGTNGGSCTFTAGSDTPYHVTAGTACTVGACVGWPTCAVTTGEFGAYGVTSCVGYTCGSTSDNMPPAAPKNLSVT